MKTTYNSFAEQKVIDELNTALGHRGIQFASEEAVQRAWRKLSSKKRSELVPVLSVREADLVFGAMTKAEKDAHYDAMSLRQMGR